MTYYIHKGTLESLYDKIINEDHEICGRLVLENLDGIKIST